MAGGPSPLPAVNEILRRVPDGHPFVADMGFPLLLGGQRAPLVILVVGLIAQIARLARQGRAAVRSNPPLQR